MRLARAALFAAGLAVPPLSGAKADCSFPLAWPFCIAGAVVNTAATIATAPFRGVSGSPYYYGYAYHYSSGYYHYSSGYYHHRRHYHWHYAITASRFDQPSSAAIAQPARFGPASAATAQPARFDGPSSAAIAQPAPSDPRSDVGAPAAQDMPSTIEPPAK
jgi:hypothetical protein